MKEDELELSDIDFFIDGLKNSFDILGDSDPMQSRGFQVQFAKAISILRLKKIAKIDFQPKFGDHFTSEVIKNTLLDQLEQVKKLLASNELNEKKNFDLVLKIAKIREQLKAL